MKRTLLTIMLALISTTLFAEGMFLTLDYSYLRLDAPDFGILSSSKPVVGFDVGYVLENGFSFAVRYDHMEFNDYQLLDRNVRVIAVVPSVGIGYMFRAMDDKLLIWPSINPGYAVSVRYRYGIDDHKTGAFSWSGSIAAYYQLAGQFYVGANIGYRSLSTDIGYSDILPGTEYADKEPLLDLSGLFYGISLKHVFGGFESHDDKAEDSSAGSGSKGNSDGDAATGSLMSADEFDRKYDK